MHKTLGIIGGIGPESTILYYRWIVEKLKMARGNKVSPHIIINSIDNNQLLAFADGKKYDELTSYLAVEINKLKQAGVDFVIIAANTPHLIFDRLALSVDLPLISIVEETCKAIRLSDITNVGLLGTRFTMAGSFYPDMAKKYGIEIIVPEDAEQAYIHDQYINELIPGIVTEKTKNHLIEIITSLQKEKSIQGLILGGTELSLLLKQEDFTDLTIFDTTIIHVNSIVNYMLA